MPAQDGPEDDGERPATRRAGRQIASRGVFSAEGTIFNGRKRGYSGDPADLVEVRDGDGSDDDVHVAVVSRMSGGRRLREKDDLIRSEWIRRLRPEERGKDSRSIGVSPEEIKST